MFKHLIQTVSRPTVLKQSAIKPAIAARKLSTAYLYPYRHPRQYRAPLQAAILDWAGTTMDCGVYSPTVPFQGVFEKRKVPITVAEARGPMGRHKKVHIGMITEMPSVRERWKKEKGSYPTSKDVDSIFEEFVPMQLACLGKYSTLINGTVKAVNTMKTKYGLKIGSTTGFTTEMVNILLADAKKQGYSPDFTVAADKVEQARPFPYMVFRNMEHLGIGPVQAVVKIDDTVDGILEGVNAGTWTIGLAETGNYVALNEQELADLKKNDIDKYNKLVANAREKLYMAGADYVVDNITGVPDVIEEINIRQIAGLGK